MIAMAGESVCGRKKIVVMRTDNGRRAAAVQLKDVTTGKNLKQNVELKPGDVIIVP
jgi:protein involved in polysaccharide export with SLBB domain